MPSTATVLDHSRRLWTSWPYVHGIFIEAHKPTSSSDYPVQL